MDLTQDAGSIPVPTRPDADLLVRNADRARVLTALLPDRSAVPPTTTDAKEHRLGWAIYDRVGKRLVDVLLTSVVLLIVAPVCIILALVIRLDSPGSAIFRQVRVGKGGRRFTVYKFRTMVDGAGLRLVKGADGRWRHKTPDDPRITRVGRFLRRTSLDELPQLINVLRGEMSLVGPRPELPEIVGRYEAWQHRRHLVRPGVTGWWQVQGRSDLPMHEHTDLDLYYVEHLSPKLDAQILLRTIRVVLSGLGAF